MASSMIRCKLSDLLDTRSGSTPLTTNDRYYKNGRIPWLTSGEISQGIIRNNEHFVTEVALKNTSLQIIPKESTLIAMYGATVGQVGFLTFDSTINQAICAIMPNKNVADPRYVYYYFTCHGQSFKDLAAGSARTNISQATIQNFPLTLPGMKCQHRIAELLSTIDKSITASDGITLQLVNIIHLIYDYWFVQFDFPDENGRPYKSSGGKMVYNDQLKKEIPEGWKIAKIKDIATVVLGGTPSRDNDTYWNGNISWLNSGEVANFPIIESKEQITTDGLNNSSAKLMPEKTIAISITGYIRVSILGVPACANQSVVGVVDDKYKIGETYLLNAITNLVPYFNSKQTGNSQKHINKDIVGESLIVLPPKDILAKFTEATLPILDLIINSAKQSKQLASLRDWLLPMLMNGQVEIKE